MFSSNGLSKDYRNPSENGQEKTEKNWSLKAGSLQSNCLTPHQKIQSKTYGHIDMYKQSRICEYIPSQNSIFQLR